MRPTINLKERRKAVRATDLGLVKLVQLPASGIDRQHPAGGFRARYSRQAGSGARLTQAIWPPEDSGVHKARSYGRGFQWFLLQAVHKFLLHQFCDVGVRLSVNDEASLSGGAIIEHHS